MSQSTERTSPPPPPRRPKRDDGINLHVVNQIVEPGLCVRCGACEPACPVDIIRFDDRQFPYITREEECIRHCTRCIKVCPGAEVDFAKFDAQMFGRSPHPDSITGIAQGAYVSHSTNMTIRKKGTSGGFVTELLMYLLESGEIDGALVMGAESDERGWQERPFIARTLDDLRLATKSKYRVVPFLKPLGEMEKVEGRYAVVALPCYIHAIQKYRKVSPKLRERLKLVIGLYCNVALEPRVYEDLCEYNGARPEDVQSLEFRFGDWPGGVHATLKNGTTTKLLKLEEMKDEFNTLKLFYTPSRCDMCIDFSAEYADIAVGDPWLRGPDGRYLYPDDRTTVLVRTDAGAAALDKAVRAGRLHAEAIPIKTYMVNFEKSARYKRDLVPSYIALRRMLGLSVPRYTRPVRSDGFRGMRKAVQAAFLHLMARWKWWRKLGLFLAQTPPAIAYLRRNRKRKAERFAAAYPKAEAFVEKLMNTGR